MRHYEVVFLVHPDQSEQTAGMIEKYTSSIKAANGTIHRLEDWGRRPLAYPINKIHKAHYIMMNIECDEPTLEELVNNFRYNDAILRHLVIQQERAILDPSVILKANAKSESRRHSAEGESAVVESFGG